MKIKLSCRCKEKIIEESDLPDWPWVRTDYICMDCQRTIEIELIEE